MAPSQDILRQLNDEKAVLYIPVVVFIVSLAIIGTFGNVLVLYVYGKERRKKSSHYFILSLAVLDLCSCLIGVPTEVVDLTFPYMFYSLAACKLLRFSECATFTGSAFILMGVTFDRYYKICREHNTHFTHLKAKILCAVGVFLGIITSIPNFLLFGHKTVILKGPDGQNVTGADCSTADNVIDTKYPYIFHGVFLSMFLGSVVVYTVVYIKIGLVVWKMKTKQLGDRIPESLGSQPYIHTDIASDESAVTYEVIKDPKTRTFSRGSVNTTLVLFVITAAYVISFMPVLITLTMRSVNKRLEANLSPAQEVIFKFCLKSFFVNSAINPIIYSFMVNSFRVNAKKALKNLIPGCCRDKGLCSTGNYSC